MEAVRGGYIDHVKIVPGEHGVIAVAAFGNALGLGEVPAPLNPGEEASRIRVAQSVAKPGGPTTAPPPADAPVPTFEHGQKKSGWFSWF